MTTVIETLGFYKEKRYFICSIDNAEILWKKPLELFHDINYRFFKNSFSISIRSKQTLR